MFATSKTMLPGRMRACCKRYSPRFFRVGTFSTTSEPTSASLLLLRPGWSAPKEKWAFEADLENADRIREHAQKNALAQIQVFPLAIWSKPGRVTFLLASEFSSRNTGMVVPSFSSQDSGGGVEVEATTLDAFVRGRRPPTLIKIDLEGGEVEALAGASCI